MSEAPVREYQVKIDNAGGHYINRVMIGTAATGLVRVEWVSSRYGQMIPMNWSQVQYNVTMPGMFTLGYLVDDAQNMIVKAAIERDFEWLLLWEHDVIAPADAIIKLNKYMREEKHPIVSGLYHSRSRPSEPLIFRGRGTGAFTDFELGEKVYCDGVPTGFLLVHMAIMREMWADAEEYNYKGQITRRVFETPQRLWYDPESGDYNSLSGTSDLEWCTKVIKGDYIRKAGWDDYMDGLEDEKMPFMVDTDIFCHHIDNQTGVIYP